MSMSITVLKEAQSNLEETAAGILSKGLENDAKRIACFEASAQAVTLANALKLAAQHMEVKHDK